MEEIRKIKELLAQDRPEEWSGLPDIELYMDQVVSYLSRQSVGGKPPAITSAMINNYVKDGLLPRANGKRYQKEHLVYLTAISLLKNVLTVRDMKLLLDSEISPGEEEPFYAMLLEGVDEAYSAAEHGIDPDMREAEATSAALRLALISCAAKTACEQLLSVVRTLHPEEDPKTKKELEREAAKRAKAEKKNTKIPDPREEQE